MSRAYWFASLSLLTFSSAQSDMGSIDCYQGTSASVVDVYPSSDRLPENILRFYIYFSAPMHEATVFPAISLTDAAGQQVTGGFLKTVDGLWSPDRTRLTLIMDPGRVKTGLHASDVLGSAMKEGGRYTLSIGPSAKDGKGCPLGDIQLKTFEVIGRDRSIPNPMLWLISPPSAGSFGRLKIEMNEMIDHLSLAYRVRVLASSGAPVSGRVDIGADERVWFFTPNAPWTEDEYTIRVDPVLEDIAGNRMSGLFDQPSELKVERESKPTYIQFYTVSELD